MQGDTVVGTVLAPIAGPGLASSGAGFGQGTPVRTDSTIQVRIPVSDVARIQTNPVSVGKSARLGAGVVAVLVGLFFGAVALAFAGGD